MIKRRPMAGDWVVYEGNRYSYFESQKERLEDMETELYRHFDASGKLLYVGISLSAVVRLAAHKETSGWFNRISSIKIERFPNRRAALVAEQAAILTEKPECNIQGSSLEEV